MWVDSKIVLFLKFSSTVQKLLKVEKNPTFQHCFYGVMASGVTFQHWITFEPLKQISKSQQF